MNHANEISIVTAIFNTNNRIDIGKLTARSQYTTCSHYIGGAHNTFTLVMLIGLILLLAGCGGGNATSEVSASPSVPPAVDPTPQIDDISCESTHLLALDRVVTSSSDTNITELYDRDKTNNSSWQATNVSEELTIKMAEPALVKAMVLSWQNSDVSHGFSIAASKNNEDWFELVTSTQSAEMTIIPELIDLTTMESATALYLKLSLTGNSVSEPSQLVELEVFGCQQTQEHSVELIDWYLSVPTDEDNDGRSDRISESLLADGYQDPRFFRSTSDGGLAFATSVSGYKTSTNTNYVRVELREMLRRGNTSYRTQGVNPNNWVFSTAPTNDVENAGGVDGMLTAEVAVNQVTSTGEAYQIGRVIIGQIHANDDEPVRLYYRKLPANQNGAIYIAHEILGGDDIYYEIIGSRSNSASNPVDGIPLNEKFSYEINVEGHALTVTVTKADGTAHSRQVDMSASGYDQGGQYMYFKAGVYNQNNSGDQHDYAEATFYQITNSHQGYNGGS